MYAQSYAQPVVHADASLRTTFIRRTYNHLAGSVLAFIAVEALLLQWSGAEALVGAMLGGFSWLIVLAAFMGVSWLAEKWARSDSSPQMQYMGLGLFVLAEAVIFLPLLYIAAYFSSPDVIPTAGIITALLFGGLTMVAFTTGHDFSFLGGLLKIGGFVALGVIAASILFGFSLGSVFRRPDDPVRGRRHSLQHLERHAPLPHGSARSGLPGAVRLGSAALLVRAAGGHGLHVQ